MPFETFIENGGQFQTSRKTQVITTRSSLYKATV